MNADEKAAFEERVKREESLQEKLHKEMMSDSKKHDEALAEAGNQGELDIDSSTPSKKGK